jgi:hypothetical protein
MGEDMESIAPLFTEYFEKEFIPLHDKNNRFQKLKKILFDMYMQDFFDTVLAQSGANRPRSRTFRMAKKLKDIVTDKRFTVLDRVILGYQNFRKAFTDNSAVAEFVLKKAMGEDFWKLMAKKNPIELYKNFRMKAGRIAENMAENGLYNLKTGKQIGIDGFAVTLHNMQRDIDKLKDAPRWANDKTFIAYLYAKHALTWHERGLNPGITQEQAEKFISTIQSEKEVAKIFDKYAPHITAYFQGLLAMVYQMGGISKETFETLIDRYPNYIPLYRDLLDDMGINMAGIGATGKGLANQANPIHSAKGSDAPLRNAYESWYLHTERMVQWAMKARIMKALTDIADSNLKLRPFIKRTSPPMATKHVTAGKISDILENLGFSVGLPGEEEGKIAEDIGFDPRDILVNLYFQDVNLIKGKLVFFVWKDGKRVYYEVDPRLFDFITGIDGMQMSAYERAMNVFASMTRTGAVGLNPGFWLRNIFRDTMEATVFSQGKGFLPSNVFGGLLSQTNVRMLNALAKGMGIPKEMAELYTRSGTVMSTLSGLNPRTLNQVADRIAMEVYLGKNGGKIKFNTIHPIRAFLTVGEFFENPNRIAEFVKVYKRVLKQTGDQEEAYIRASRAAQDVTVDFARRGTIAGKLNYIIPFYNAGIQGLSKTLRSFSEKEITRYEDGQAVYSRANIGRRIIRGAMYILGLSLLSLKWRDEDEYDKLTAYNRFGYFNFWIKDDSGKKWHIQLPTPFNIGALFSASFEAAYTKLKHEDRKVFKDYAEWMMQTQILPLIPLIGDNVPAGLVTLWELATNKDFAGRPIEPPYSRENRKPEDIIKVDTTEMAKEVSKDLNKFGLAISPVQVDFLLNNITGGAYKNWTDYAQFFSGMFKKDGNIPLEDFPVIRAVVRSERPMSNKYVSRYYEMYGKYRVDREKYKYKEPIKEVNKMIKFYNDILAKPFRKAHKPIPKKIKLILDRIKAAVITAKMREIERAERNAQK